MRIRYTHIESSVCIFYAQTTKIPSSLYSGSFAAARLDKTLKYIEYSCGFIIPICNKISRCTSDDALFVVCVSCENKS